MEIMLPADCGNAPRIEIVSNFVVNWAKGDAEATSEWLADDVRWTYVGSKDYQQAFADFTPERIELYSVITHGRLASCDGYLESSGKRVDFSHAIRFASTSKTAKIAELRSYCFSG